MTRSKPPEVVEQAKALKVEVELPSLMEHLGWRDRRAAAKTAHTWDVNKWPITTDVGKLGHLESISRRLKTLERTFGRRGVDADALVNLIHTTDRLADVAGSARQRAEKDVSEVLGKAPSRGEAALDEIFDDQNLRGMMIDGREKEILLETVLKSQKSSGMKMRPFVESLGLTGREVDVKSLFK